MKTIPALLILLGFLISACTQVSEESAPNLEPVVGEGLVEMELLSRGVDPEDDSDFASAEGVWVMIVEDHLKLYAAYSGGCEEHEFSLSWSGAYLESDPIQVPLQFTHNSNLDVCEAFLEEILVFDLSPLKESYKKTYQTTHGELMLIIDERWGTLEYKF